MQSHFIVKPNLVLRLGWGFDNFLTLREGQIKWNYEIFTYSGRWDPYDYLNLGLNLGGR